jgi:hypothetical protein
MFVALRQDRFQEVWTHSMALPHMAPLETLASEVKLPVAQFHETQVADAAHVAAVVAPLEPKPEGKMQSPSMRKLIYRFWDLSIGERREITLKLGLITEADLQVPEPERYKKAFKVAMVRGLLAELATEIERIENTH